MKRFFVMCLFAVAASGVAAGDVSVTPAYPTLRSPLELIGAIEPWWAEEKELYIVNGQPTNYQMYKSVIAIMSGGSLCTASLIDPEVLLTAGHCVYLYENGQLVMDAISNPSSITVRGGANVFWGATTLAYGKEVVKHSTWTGNINTWNAVDLALIHLDRKVLSLDPLPIRVQPNETKGETGVIVGYGITSSNASDSGVHRYGNTTILNIGNIMGKQLIEIGNPAGACQGDSGGPFLTQQFGRDVVSGVASFVTGQCSATSGSYYTWVLPYRDWIESIVVQFTGHGFVNEETCGDANDVCSPGETKDCHEIEDYYASGTAAPCNDGCYYWEVSVCSPNCGDGLIMEPEVCDSDEKNCQELGAYLPDKNAPCKNDCSGYDTSGCNPTACGDGVKQGNEFCDGDTVSCTVLGSYPWNYYARCNDTCTGYSVSDCENGVIVCGNGVIDPTEECDDGNTNSWDGCSSRCKIDTPRDYDVVVIENDTAVSDDSLPDETISDSEEEIGPDGEVPTSDEEPVSDNEEPVSDTTSPDDTASSAVCGNGIVEAGEQCDDGNLIPGDGCDPDCTFSGMAPGTDKPLPRASDGCSCALVW